MKKAILICAALFGMTIVASANSEYAVNDAAIDALVECSIETASVPVSFASADLEKVGNEAKKVWNKKNEGVAVALCFVLGGFGIHRHYLGTAKWMWAAYTFTLGGIFGIVPLVDFVVMIIDLVTGEGMREFYGNEKFFAWI